MKTDWTTGTLDGQRFRVRMEYEPIEGASPQGESNAAACFGAGRPKETKEPRAVLGPGEILAKLQAFMEDRKAGWETVKEIDDYNGGRLHEFELINKHLTSLIGPEGQDAP